MSTRVEKLISEYPQMVSQKKCLAYQVAHFRGLSPEDVITSMYTAHHEGERVQTSGTSDKTAQIAMNYRDRLNQMNREWYEHLEWRLRCVSDELDFFESALHSLPADLEPVMWDLVVQQLKWEAVEQKYAISHTTVYRMRKRAMTALEAMYKKHDQETAAYMLGAEG